MNNIGNNNKWKKHFFSRSDYKTISSVFDIKENSFTIDEIIYCPNIKTDDHEFYKDGKLYTIKLKMSDMSQFEDIFKLKKAAIDVYEMNLYKNSINPDIKLMIESYGTSIEKPEYSISLYYLGYNEKLDNIIPFISI